MQNLDKFTEGDLPNQHTKKRDKQDHNKEKEQAMIGQGESPEDTHETQPEILPHTRPPEKDPTTGQDTPSKDKDRTQTETHRNNRQDPRANAKSDVNKVLVYVGRRKQLQNPRPTQI